jgi:hypothetical protein
MKLMYTPAPWSIENEDGRTYITGDGGQLAKVLLPSTNLRQIGKQAAIAKANARLMAAASELLTACVAVVELCSLDDERPQWVEQCRVAIAKAVLGFVA